MKSLLLIILISIQCLSNYCIKHPLEVYEYPNGTIKIKELISSNEESTLDAADLPLYLGENLLDHLISLKMDEDQKHEIHNNIVEAIYRKDHFKLISIFKLLNEEINSLDYEDEDYTSSELDDTIRQYSHKKKKKPYFEINEDGEQFLRNGKSEGKIIIDDYKYNAIIFSMADMERVCAAAILNRRLVITAASCVQDKDARHLHIITGPHPTFRHYNISKIFFPSTNTNHIAIIRVKTPMRLASLSTIPISFSLPQPMANLNVTGGRCQDENDANLYEGMMRVTSDNKCRKSYPKKKEGMFCAEPIEMYGGRKCFEEMGSPVVRKGRLVAVVVEVGEGMASRYIRVKEFKQWIKNTFARASGKFVKKISDES